MKKIKKIIVLAMATTMLLGATLTVNAAGCVHNPQSHTYSETSNPKPCGTHNACSIITTTYYSCGKCIYCGALFNVKPTYTSVSHSK